MWEGESKVLYALREDLLEGMSFAFRKDETLMKHLRAIKKGRSHAKTIQDLANLSVLDNANKHLLEAIILTEFPKLLIRSASKKPIDIFVFIDKT